MTTDGMVRIAPGFSLHRVRRRLSSLSPDLVVSSACAPLQPSGDPGYDPGDKWRGVSEWVVERARVVRRERRESMMLEEATTG